MQQESDVEGPAFTGNPLRGTVDERPGRAADRAGRHLVRRGSQARVTDSGGSQYGHRIDITLAGVGFAFIRGYAWADLAVGRGRLKFVTTHFESLSADLALAQAGELHGTAELRPEGRRDRLRLQPPIRTAACSAAGQPRAPRRTNC